MNKSFINKQNGIKRNVINNVVLALTLLGLVLCGVLGGTTTARAKTVLKTYTQPFQNNTTSLSGQSVEMSTYFIKMDYWNVKKATLNLNYQVSQLSSRQLSDITVSLGGVKFASFRPKKQTGLQTKTIKIPLRLLSGENELKISGQILNQAGKKDYRLTQTPANWLTVDNRSDINFQYALKAPTKNIDSFYDHFSGPDTIVNRNAYIVVPNHANNAELAASMYALTGESRVITTENQQIPVVQMNNVDGRKADYQLIIAEYQHLPGRFKKLFRLNDLKNASQIKRYDSKGKHYLVVTATTGALLKKAARFVANSELMKESKHPTETVTLATQTFTSTLNYDGKYQLTTSADKVTGVNHQERQYFVSLPIDRNNADGSTISIHLRYARNLDFKNSLATIYVNDTAVGSKRLSSARADNDTLTVTLPKGMALGNSFTVRVALDLPLSGTATTQSNNHTPWASIEPDSVARIKSAPGNDLLFSNYPNLFLKNSTYDNIAVVRPKTMSSTDYQTLTNIFNLIGNYAENNRGTIKFYDQQPSKSVMTDANVIAFGTPRQNSLIHRLNSHLYFKYNSSETGFLSNEKLSIEQKYGQTIGSDQLLRSPYNSKKGLMVVTGATDTGAYLASTQINYQRNIDQYSGDAIVVDPDNNHYDYRFKKNKLIDTSLNTKQEINRHSQQLRYLGMALIMIVVVTIALLLLLWKHGSLHRRRKGRTRHD
uniref:cellulose biosynthesis cyclic di-GMP-binding regulatory protein BcsB n=1 Tax=Levilactobacillus sp. HBUAS70063 TaxID=3109359 RepID=UPI003132D677